jgi:hypothetical protein
MELVTCILELKVQRKVLQMCAVACSIRDSDVSKINRRSLSEVRRNVLANSRKLHALFPFSLIQLRGTFPELLYRIHDEEVHLQLVEIDVACFLVLKW